MSAGRRLLFKLAAILFVPLFLLATVELGLRLAGSGYPTHFFVKSHLGGTNVLIDNPKFSWRFFPRHLARSPQPVVLPAQKPPQTLRVFVFGESAAMGDPEPAFGFPRILERLLNARFKAKKFEVVNVSMTAINSHAILPIARDCSHHQGDYWVIYAGNNEVHGPFGAGTVFGAQVPPLKTVRARLALKESRMVQWLESVTENLGGYPPRQTWEGMEMFLDQQIPLSDPRLARVYHAFEQNLREILAVGKNKGVKIIASTVPTNLRDCAPFGSRHSRELSSLEKKDWEQFFNVGRELEKTGKFGEALQQFEKAAGIDDDHAELQFHFGRCLAGLEKTTNALVRLERARDLDTLRFRADSRINQLIRKTVQGRESENIFLLDSATLFNQFSKSGIPGEELFHEHVHLTFEGNFVLALLVAQQMDRTLEKTFGQEAEQKWLSISECAHQLAYTPWARYRITGNLLGRLSKPPFTNQWTWPEQQQNLQKQLLELKAAAPITSFEPQARVYREALGLATNDWVLHDQFGKFLEAFGDIETALKHWEKVIELVPHHLAVHVQMGNALNRPATASRAENYLRRALELRPDVPEVVNDLGLCLSYQKKFPAAYEQFSKALEARPHFPQVHYNWGLALAAEGKTAEALARFDQCLKQNPDYVPAHLQLGKRFAELNQYQKAAHHYERLLKLRPDDADVHFHFAELQGALGNHGPAIASYQRVISLKPDRPEAHYRLAGEYVRDGKLNLAAAEFAETLRLDPNHAPSHFNLGVAQVQQLKIEEGIQSFREALRLNPTNEQAREYLAKAEAILRKKRPGPVRPPLRLENDK